MEIRLIVSSAVRVCTARLRHSDGAALGFRFQREKSCMKSGNVLLLIIVALTLLIMATATSFAQLVSGNLTGTVYDVSGAVVPNATVIAHNDATGVENTAVSTSAGEYRIVNLPAGTYSVTVTAAGFSKAELKDVQIELNVTSTANVTLQVGKSDETVEVSDSRA